MARENEICQVWRRLDTGMSDQENGFEGSSEQARQLLGEAVVPEEGGPSDRLPSGAAEQEWESHWWQPISHGALESCSGQQALEAHHGLTGH